MKLLADECCEASVVHALRTDGHDVLYVAEAMRRLSDLEVLRHSIEERRVLVTEDKDFGELVYRLHRPAHGIILLRFAEDEHDDKIQRLLNLVTERGRQLTRSFVVLERHKTRIRPLKIEP